MIDQYGNLIRVGDTVITVQPSGGILPPAPPVKGLVIKSVPWDENSGMAIVYGKPPRFILLEGKINTLDIT